MKYRAFLAEYYLLLLAAVLLTAGLIYGVYGHIMAAVVRSRS
jgi:hypothetical protein